MTETLKIRKFGGSLGLVLPKSIVDAVAMHDGDDVFVTATPDGIFITYYDPKFADALEDARQFMRSHRDSFKALTK